MKIRVTLTATYDYEHEMNTDNVIEILDEYRQCAEDDPFLFLSDADIDVQAEEIL